MMDKLKTLLERIDQDGDEDPNDRIRDLVQILLDGLEDSQKLGEEIMEKYKP